MQINGTYKKNTPVEHFGDIVFMNVLIALDFIAENLTSKQIIKLRKMRIITDNF